MTTRDLIVQELERMPEVILRAVLDFLRLLKRAYPIADQESRLGQFAGILDDEEAAAIRATVETEFERVNLHDW
jgi:hypothetical protein